MMKNSVEVKIAGRNYPVTIKESDEQNVLAAARLINKQVAEFESSFAVKDKQDLLAMSALQIIAGQISTHTEFEKEQNVVAQNVIEIESFVSSYLKKVK